MDSVRKITHAYFVGIQGVGMAALAVLVKQMGIQVGGSDIAQTFQTSDTLKLEKIPFNSSFNSQNISGFFSSVSKNNSIVIYTGAHGGSSNIEVIAAKKMGITVLPHGKALALFTNDKKTIAVSGSHGKTTTAAMIAHILTKTGLDPTYVVGSASIGSLGASGKYGDGEFAVVEADEYVTDPGVDTTPRFHHLSPYIGIITSIDYDHPDVFKTLDDVKNAFISFAKKVNMKGAVIACLESPGISDILTKLPQSTITYGFQNGALYTVAIIKTTETNTEFNLRKGTENIGLFKISIPGTHNVLNAVVAILASIMCGVSVRQISESLVTFSGTKRRLEFIKEHNGTLYFDDYAHHPTEIKATLAAIKLRYPKRRIVALFQPHTFSRTRSLLTEFGSSFFDADIVLIAPIFSSSRESTDPGISAAHVVEQINKFGQDALLVRSKEEFAVMAAKIARANDIIITMGAGDIYTWQQGL